MNIEIESLADTIPNIRTVKPPKEADDALAETVRLFGVLQPILVRPAGNRFEIICGRRRTRAAQAAGLHEIPAEVRDLTDAQALAAQVVEDKQKALIHPIDIWRATQGMLDAGVSLPHAAMALGLDERQTRRMERLAQLHPQVLALAEIDMPTMGQLGAIAAAPLERQAEALKVRGAVMRRDISWHVIAGACRQDTIALGTAIFDVAASGIAFEEDLFAAPGSPDQFVTRDIAGFLKAQQAALQARVEQAAARGERLRLADCREGRIVLPRGWSASYRADSKPLKKPDGPVRFVGISDRWDVGAIKEQVADPPRTPGYQALDLRAGAGHRAAKPAPAAASASVAESSSSGEVEPDEESSERPPITKRGLQMIAAAKQHALRTRIRERGPELSLEMLLGCLLLALSSDNVRVHAGRFEVEDLSDLRPRLVDVSGRFSPDAGEIYELAADALSRMLVVTDPVTMQGSGAPAEWTGHVLGADQVLARFDTAAFLQELSSEELRRMARAADVSVPKKVSELRQALIGHAPGFRPASFGAPGPKPKPQRARRHAEEETVA